MKPYGRNKTVKFHGKRNVEKNNNWWEEEMDTFTPRAKMKQDLRQKNRYNDSLL